MSTIREDFEAEMAIDKHIESEFIMVRVWHLSDPEFDDRGTEIRRIVISHERLRRQLATMTAERDTWEGRARQERSTVYDLTVERDSLLAKLPY